MQENKPIPPLSGRLTPEHLEKVNSHQLIDGKSYGCDHCGKTHVAPYVRRCICGLIICDGCADDHESSG